MKKKHICLTALALVLVASVWSTGVRLALGQAEYSAPNLELWEGQANYDLLAGIEYDTKRYTLSIQDLGGFDINSLGIYTVSYALTPISTEPSVESSVDSKNSDKSSVAPSADSEISVEPTPIAESGPDTQPETSVYSSAKDVTLKILDPMLKAKAGEVAPQAPRMLGASQLPIAFEAPVVTETSSIQESPVEADLPVSIFFTRQVTVKEALTYADQRLELGMTDLLSGFVNHVEGYSVVVVDNGDFDPNIVNEYQVTYALYNPSGRELRQFQRYIQVTQPGVEFYAPELAAEADLDARNWTEDINFDRTRYTITLLTKPDLEATKPQRLLYRLDEIVPTGIEVVLAEEAEVDLTQSDPVEGSDAHLAAIFGREVTLLHDGNTAEKQIIFSAPDLVITIEELESMDYIDLLQGVTAVDENGEAVQVQVSDRSQLDQAGLPPTELEQEVFVPSEVPDTSEESVETEAPIESEVPLEPGVPVPSEIPDTSEESVESEEPTESEVPLEPEAPAPSEVPSTPESPIVSQKPGESPIVFQNPGESPVVFENPEISVEVVEDSESEEPVAVESVADPALGVERLEVGVA